MEGVAVSIFGCTSVLCMRFVLGGIILARHLPWSQTFGLVASLSTCSAKIAVYAVDPHSQGKALLS